MGLVASLNQPGANITGTSALTVELDPKLLQLLHELSPPGAIGVLVNPNRPDKQIQIDSIKAAAQSAGRELVLGYAGAVSAIDAAFATFKSRSIAGLLVGTADRRSISGANSQKPAAMRAMDRTGGAAANQIRVRDQSQSCKGARPDRAARLTRPR